MNENISASLNQWDADFDPYGFVERADWVENAEKTEDLLQLTNVYGELVIDVGFYTNVYKAYVVEHQNWEFPVESYETTDCSTLNAVICAWMDKYANGK